jgi:hypothetical protein
MRAAPFFSTSLITTPRDVIVPYIIYPKKGVRIAGDFGAKKAAVSGTVASSIPEAAATTACVERGKLLLSVPAGVWRPLGLLPLLVPPASAGGQVMLLSQRRQPYHNIVAGLTGKIWTAGASCCPSEELRRAPLHFFELHNTSFCNIYRERDIRIARFTSIPTRVFWDGNIVNPARRLLQAYLKQ